MQPLEELFPTNLSKEERYKRIMNLGKSIPSDPPEDSSLVPGCQSKMYLATHLEKGRLYFTLSADALISKGIGALLLHLYNGCEPAHLFKSPPTILQELQIISSLSMSRANGLASLYDAMKRQALPLLARNNFTSS